MNFDLNKFGEKYSVKSCEALACSVRMLVTTGTVHHIYSNELESKESYLSASLQSKI